MFHIFFAQSPYHHAAEKSRVGVIRVTFHLGCHFCQFFLGARSASQFICCHEPADDTSGTAAQSAHHRNVVRLDQTHPRHFQTFCVVEFAHGLINEVALVCRNGNGLFLADFDFYALRDFFYPQMVVQLQRHTDAVKARSHIGRCGRYPYMNHNRSLLFSFFPFSLPIFAVKNKTRLIRRRCGSISLPFYLLFLSFILCR